MQSIHEIEQLYVVNQHWLLLVLLEGETKIHGFLTLYEKNFINLKKLIDSDVVAHGFNLVL